jgi:hypothetical protein
MIENDTQFIGLSSHHSIDCIKEDLVNLINENLNPVDGMRKQWKHQMIWNHMKSLLFYSGDTNDQIKPAEE